ncbi:hypothetical protein N7471_006677 [Penicillium samsonianum]|uniref:uncharacterized protein n=1 Tax=Penicillium samsonianum TaxID=1882272 RepID=UPI002547F819|nr:uncharacterized protein N7471_006677 [Penicillium samsonianum]KAJ6140191.1 hypothetical protein N7471_006677 [Penicillium samsonianum]
MATVEKVKDQQKQFKVQQGDSFSGEDYDTADDYEYSDESFEESASEQLQQKQQKQQKQPQLQQKRQQQQLQKLPRQQQSGHDNDDYSDDYSDEYEDDYSDDDDEDLYDVDEMQGKALQSSEQRNTDIGNRSGSMSIVQKEKKDIMDEEGLKLRLELNLEIEIVLKAHIQGDLTLSLM